MKQNERKGSVEAKMAGLKAAATRARNKALGISSQKTKLKVFSDNKRVAIKDEKLTNFLKLSIDYPCDIFIDKTTRALYISPSNVKLLPQLKQICRTKAGAKRVLPYYTMVKGQTIVVNSSFTLLHQGLMKIQRKTGFKFSRNKISKGKYEVIRIS